VVKVDDIPGQLVDFGLAMGDKQLMIAYKLVKVEVQKWMKGVKDLVVEFEYPCRSLLKHQEVKHKSVK